MNPIIWLSLGLVIISILLAFIFLFIKTHIEKIKKEEKKKRDLALQYQKELLKTTILTQEKERERIAQDIHDGLVSKLNVIRLSKKDEKQINTQIADCIKTVRLISHDLTPPLIEETPIDTLLHKVVSVLDQDTIHLETHCSLHTTASLSPTTKLQIIRVIQEVTTNTLKHAQATQIRFLIRHTEHFFSIKMEDNGVGFNATKSQGLGLKNITARIQLLQGTHIFKSTPKKGSIFLFSIPLDKKIVI